MVKEGDTRLVLRIEDSFSRRVAAWLRVSPPKHLRVLTELDPTADSCMVWAPGQPHPEAVTAGSEGKRTCGAFFMAFVDAGPERLMVVEDGFVLVLDDDTWATLHDALAHEQSVEIPARGERPAIAVEWF